MVAVLLLLLFLTPLHAQVNIETYRGKRGVTGEARFSLSSDVGNVDVFKGDGAGHITVNTAHGVLLGVCKGAAGFLGGERFTNSGVLRLRWTATASPRWRPEFFAQADYAKSRRLESRHRAHALEQLYQPLTAGTGRLCDHGLCAAGVIRSR